MTGAPEGNVSGVHPGQVLAGKYRVERVLGQGGMGVVVAATHLQLEQRVALKFMLPQALNNPEAVARFAREARAAVRIKGEHVARVIDVGTLENSAPYLVMEFLEGRDLSAALRELGPLPVAEAVDYVLQACEALAEAHTLGIVHRDLKPANLFLTTRPDGTPSIKVLDFGISKLTNASASDNAMTRTSAVMGSPLYMSPEQMTASRDVDARSDLWAVGAILFELLTGQVPFSAETLPQICGLILTAPPRGIAEFRGDVPPALQAVVLRCLEKDRALRFQHVGELALALAPFGSRVTSRSVERISRILQVAGITTNGALPPQSIVLPPGHPAAAQVPSPQGAQSVQTAPGAYPAQTAQTGHGAPAQTGHGAPAQTGHGAPAQTGHGAPVQTGHGAPVQTGHGVHPAQQSTQAAWSETRVPMKSALPLVMGALLLLVAGAGVAAFLLLRAAGEPAEASASALPSATASSIALTAAPEPAPTASAPPTAAAPSPPSALPAAASASAAPSTAAKPAVQPIAKAPAAAPKPVLTATSTTKKAIAPTPAPAATPKKKTAAELLGGRH